MKFAEVINLAAHRERAALERLAWLLEECSLDEAVDTLRMYGDEIERLTLERGPSGKLRAAATAGGKGDGE